MASECVGPWHALVGALPPAVIFREDAQAHGSRRINVGMKEAHGKLALGRLAGVVLGELHGERVEAGVPQGILLARNLAYPLEKVHRPANMGTPPNSAKVRKRIAGEQKNNQIHVRTRKVAIAASFKSVFYPNHASFEYAHTGRLDGGRDCAREIRACVTVPVR